MSVHFLPTTTRTASPAGLGSVKGGRLAEAAWHLRAATRALHAGLRAAIRRARTRRHLSELDTHLLRDIGVTFTDAQLEAAKPFWQG